MKTVVTYVPGRLDRSVCTVNNGAHVELFLIILNIPNQPLSRHAASLNRASIGQIGFANPTYSAIDNVLYIFPVL